MKIRHIVVAAIIAVMLPPLAARAQAAQLEVYASTAIKAVLQVLGPQFEKASGDKLVFVFGSATVLSRQIDHGAVFDVAILTAALTDRLAASGKIAPASRVTIARSGMGVAVRAGSPKPDIGTAVALKRTLLNAHSIGYSRKGLSGLASAAMLKKLGIADALKPKIKVLGENAAVAVAKGDVEIGLTMTSAVPAVAGAELAGPFPASLQTYLVFAAGIASARRNAAAAKALIEFLSAPAAASVYKAKGMEPE